MDRAWTFNFEGDFLGFANDAEGKLKYVQLQLADQAVQIKLPKELRVFARLNLQVGDRLRITGIGKHDSRGDKLKLKAGQIYTLPHSPTVPLNPLLELALPARKSPRATPKAKILVCQKSGCRKKGGGKLLQELERVLRERNLLDQIVIETTGCLKRCSSAPNFVILPDKKIYNRVHPEEITAALQKHL